MMIVQDKLRPFLGELLSQKVFNHSLDEEDSTNFKKG